MIERVIEDLASGLGEWAYLLVAFMAMAETAAFLGFVAPGEFTIIFGGVLAGEGTLSIQLLIGIAWASCVIGDSIGFYLGHRLGRRFALDHGPKVRLTEERFLKVEDFFRRHGGKTIFIGRWLGLVRPLMPFTAGASGMSYGRFLPYDVLGAGLWATTWCLVGYIFWRSFEQVASTAGRGTLAFAVLLALVVGGYQAVKRLRHPEQRRAFAQWLDRQTQRPLLRPLGWLGRVIAAMMRPLWRYVLRPVWVLVAPPLRFVAGRLTPGELGIELGPLLAGAGIVGVALGFGSQTLVRDFLSGVFILVEDQFGVGDVVNLDGTTSGSVEAVSLRTTRLRAVDGTVWHVPNGEIRRVGNMSQHWSRSLLDIEVGYGTDLDHAKAVIAGPGITGEAKLYQEYEGRVRIVLKLEGTAESKLTPGRHAIHIHETGACEPFTAAKGHFDGNVDAQANPEANVANRRRSRAGLSASSTAACERGDACQ